MAQPDHYHSKAPKCILGPCQFFESRYRGAYCRLYGFDLYDGDGVCNDHPWIKEKRNIRLKLGGKQNGKISS